ncbi:uncharacterized protein K452DRAFT_245182 [Aplosporella prunicola CBS 121167]|uniref:MAPEG family protein n=1 Tax=Aplosporella prunicola CBS 121167 TaxID=1176127 RepID=A0A6A6BJR6_9PEZI|nr:uncharacterized protein K452DRAFT_245182 [Aplosporella prunicola CBS 121167]KAF2144390.1 hypothetical protein K452DRAFT_245182 [Aplosporella prunicola CBS 121167]
MVQVGLGVPMPMLAPVTATWTAPFAAYLIFLSNRIVYQRLKHKALMGDRLATTTGAPDDDPLYLATRTHANFLETVPVTLGVAALAELNGANRRWLHGALATMFVLRVAHLELGIMGTNASGRKSAGWGRIPGYYGTQAVLLGLAGYTAWIVRGYWGF